MLCVHIFDALEAFECTLSPGEEILVGKEIVLPLISPGQIQKNKDKLCSSEAIGQSRKSRVSVIFSRRLFESGTYRGSTLRESGMKELAHDIGNLVAKVLLISKRVQDSQAQLCLLPDFCRVEQRVQVLSDGQCILTSQSLCEFDVRLCLPSRTPARTLRSEA